MALALRPAATPGRLVLAAAGVASVLVAANPEHVEGSPTRVPVVARGTDSKASPVGVSRTYM